MHPAYCPEVQRTAPHIVHCRTGSAKGKGKKKKKKAADDDEEPAEGKKKKRGKKKKEEEEEEVNTDDEIWKQYDSDADLDAPYVPKVSSSMLQRKGVHFQLPK